MIFFSHDVWISTRETSVSLVLYLRANSARKDAQGKRRNEAEMNKIFWAADSTVQTNDFTTYPQTGIGQVFPLFVKNEYQIVNHAKNGRSTKSFMDEGRLKAIEEKIGAGDFQMCIRDRYNTL